MNSQAERQDALLRTHLGPEWLRSYSGVLQALSSVSVHPGAWNYRDGDSGKRREFWGLEALQVES